MSPGQPQIILRIYWAAQIVIRFMHFAQIVLDSMPRIPAKEGLRLLYYLYYSVKLRGFALKGFVLKILNVVILHFIFD